MSHPGTRMVYAVACGSEPGIYFDWKDGAEMALRGLASPVMEKFPSIAQAKRYLEFHGLVMASVDSEWISKNRAPILFRYSSSTPSSSTQKKKTTTTSRTPSTTTSIPDRTESGPPRPANKRPRTSTTTETTTSTATSAPSTTTSTPTTNANQTTPSLEKKTTTTKIPFLSDDEDDDDEDLKNLAPMVVVNTTTNADINSDSDSDDDTDHDEDRKNVAPILTGPSALDDGDDDDDSILGPLPPPPPRPVEHKLDPCQQRAIDAARDGRNIFLTGVAGTGKSLVTKLIYQEAVSRYGGPPHFHKEKAVALCAPTGMAAVGLGANGQTIHTFAGVKVPFRASDFGTMYGRGNIKKWLTVQCLIMDEVGMLSADFLDWLDVYVREIRHRPLEPFGGIQLIFVGDFAQLGPIPGNLSLQASASKQNRVAAAAKAAAADNGGGGGAKAGAPAWTTGPPYPPGHPGADCLLNIQEMTGFAFQTALWREAKFCHVHLTRVYRQSDRAFVQALMDLRQQRPDTELVQDFVEKCSISLDYNKRQKVFGDEAIQIPEGLLPTLLYTNNRNADRENAERLASLNTEHKRFVAQDSVHVDKNVPTNMVTRTQEILHANKFFEQCQANKFLDLKVGAQVMLVQNISTELELINGSRGVVERFRLVPVVTHVMGTEERRLSPDDCDKFPPGCSFEKLKFGMTLTFDNMTWKITKFEKYPLVRFLNNRTKIILPTTFERTMFDQGTCRRVQLPLRLSWALTIHKAQGCTLDWLICDLAGCFTAGQAYVALSRAKSMAGLQIRNFSTKAVLTNPLVDRFYEALKDDTIEDFLRNEAGLWWYPLLDHPEWLQMFTKASYNYRVQSNASQFSMWVANYSPPDGYKGWNGYSDRIPIGPSIAAPIRSPSTSLDDSKGKALVKHLVTPTN